jgi:DNA helicase-2/ATP-dependent DNA helicase PcrA
VTKLGANAKRYYIAGDDDQSIFHWAGADSSVFQNLSVDSTIVLDQSHRVSKAVHSAAMRIVKRIEKRLVKEYSPTSSNGEVLNAGPLGSLDLREETFILFRNHFRGSAITQQLRDDRIPYIGNGSILNDPGVRASLYGFYTLLRKGYIDSTNVKYFLKNADENYLYGNILALSKVHKRIPINEVFIEIPKPHMWTKILPKVDNEGIRALIRKNGFMRTATPKVEIMSIHQSKGREAHTVYIDPEMSRASWLGMLANPDDEHRVSYVAITRAKERVFFLIPDGQYSYRY